MLPAQGYTDSVRGVISSSPTAANSSQNSEEIDTSFLLYLPESEVIEFCDFIFNALKYRLTNEELDKLPPIFTYANTNREKFVVDLAAFLGKHPEPFKGALLAAKVDQYAKLHFEMQKYKQWTASIIENVQMQGKGVSSDYSSLQKHISLVKNSEGHGGSYLAFIEEKPCFVVKPVDEDIDGYNNRYGLASLNSIYQSLESANRSIYRAPMNDAMMYELAFLIGVKENVPETTIMILKNDAFFTALSQESEAAKQQALEVGVRPDLEKVCTLQRYIDDSFPVVKMGLVLLDEYGEDVEQFDAATLSLFDQNDVENMNLLMWLSYEFDSHAGNILMKVKGVDKEGRPTYGLMKIDSTFSFPRHNTDLKNGIAHFPNSKFPLSNRIKGLIEAIDNQKVINKMQELGYEQDHLDAMSKRIDMVKKLSKQEGLSMREIDRKLKWNLM